MSSVLVLAGGTSDEKAVSLRSGAAVAAALQKVGHVVRQHDPAKGLSATDLQGIDVAFPVLHGSGGEDGSLQAELDKLGVPYVGSDAASSKLCFDKWRFKQLLMQNGLPTPRAVLVGADTFWQAELIKRPFVLKPNDGGSSIDTLIVRHADNELDRAKISDIFSRHAKLLLEELIEGTEITVAVLGDQPLPVIEIIPPPSGEFDYENKYNGQSQEICPPEHVGETVQAATQALSLQVHHLAGCRDFSRTDIMIDGHNIPYVLEINTIPGMTDQSLFPKAAAAADIPMEQLVDRLVQLALNH